MAGKVTDEAFLASWERHKSPTLVAKDLGISERGVMSRRRTLEVRHGVKLATIYRDPGRIHGTSTLYGPDGETKLQWVKRDTARPNLEQLGEIVRDVFAGTAPVARVPAPKTSQRDLLTCYAVGDHHLAMYAWGEEAGADYDMETSERLLVAGAGHLVEVAPPSDVGLICNVGDFFHVDGLRPETTRNRNALDVDTRYAAMIRAGVRMLRTFIDCALVKHRRVVVVNACGNHDDVGALWLSLALGLLYEKNPRVEVERTPAKFIYRQHGRVLLGITHGDTVKLPELAGVMAADQPELWGATAHRYWLTGHIHQRRVLELAGVTVESFRTLAARDAWASAAGYRSGRDMVALVYHAEHGEVARHRFDVGMLA